jgi:hypothetical protein
MALMVVEMTGTIVFMLKWAMPTPSKGHESRVATNPLLTTARFDQRHPLTATEPTMLASNRFGCHSVVSQRLSSIRRHGVIQVDIHPSPSLYCLVSAFRGCLKSPEMSVFDRCRAISEGAPIALSPLKSIMPIFTWIPCQAARETFQTASQEPG